MQEVHGLYSDGGTANANPPDGAKHLVKRHPRLIQCVNHRRSHDGVCDPKVLDGLRNLLHLEARKDIHWLTQADGEYMRVKCGKNMKEW